MTTLGNDRGPIAGLIPGALRLAAGVLAALQIGLAPAQAETNIGIAEKVVRNVYGDNLLQRMQAGTSLVANQRVRTGEQSAAGLVFLDDTRLSIGPASEVRLDEFVYSRQRSAAKGTLNVVKGLLRFASSKGRVDIRLKTKIATIGVRGTVFDVLANTRETEVAVHQGAVEVESGSGSRLVRAGEVLRISADGRPQYGIWIRKTCFCSNSAKGRY
ncbi:MAG: FecR family protein [Alphaproteobacteria bacterium]|jgi:hypothetical protein|nr:FecR family protein [Alphaproteobacteria bacterium]